MNKKFLHFCLRSWVFPLVLGFADFAEAANIKSFVLESHYAVPAGEVAEIASATPDGRFLYYTNASGRKIGILNIEEPSNPVAVNYVSTKDAEPTSLAVNSNGKYLVAVMRNGDNLNTPAPGTLSLYEIIEDGNLRHLGDVKIGIGPDSVALANQGEKLVAVVAIEDEETNDEGDATIDGKRPGRVDVIELNPENPPASRVASVEFPKSALDQVSGVNFTSDPQPEFVAIHPNQKEAAVTLQENNAVAIIDIENPQRPKVKNIFSAGAAARKADIKDDGKVDFSDDFKGRRESDGIAYITVGNEIYLALANEGDSNFETFGDGVHSGGRGVSLHKMNGDAVWDSGTELEREASLLGHYPDSRSEERSIEAEGVVGARLFEDDILIAGSERGSFIAVYGISDPSRPELLKILPTGGRPEGIVVVGGRADGKKLIVTSNEGDGTINIYSVWAD